MTDDLYKRRQEHGARIAVDQPYERRHWAEKFGVTEQRLCEAVLAVGPMADAVERYLERTRTR